MFKKLISLIWLLLPAFVLVAVNLFTFRHHYLGTATFPWDFLGGYHTQSFGWFDAGGVTAPPKWFPWTSMGFPAFLAIQSGAWYLPLVLLNAFGVVYTIHAATVVQVLHVLFGALGMYALARRVGFARGVALLSALAFHFSATFYSNQEHVDIVRAAAWLPWVLFTLHPSAFRSRWGIALGALVLSQFLISGYPGVVVASIYACAFWFAVFWAGQAGRSAKMSYTCNVAISVFAGTLISMPKWLPLLLAGSSALAIEHFPPSPFVRGHLLTLLMPYDLASLPGDLTMRSLWVPLAALWGMAFIDFRRRVSWVGGGLAAMALFMGMYVQGSEALAHWVPGLRISRFPISDWRPVLHVGLLLCGAAGWTNFLAGLWSPRSVVLRSIAASAVCSFLILKAIRAGYSPEALTRPIELVWVLTALTVCRTVVSPAALGTRTATLIIGMLLVVATADGVRYNQNQLATWAPAWSDEAEASVFGRPVSSFVAARDVGSELSRRPRRAVIGASAAEALMQRNSLLNNRCWYTRTFCVFSYDNIRMSLPHRKFAEALAAPGGEDLLRFATDAQQLLIVDAGQSTDIPAFASSDAPAIGSTDGLDVSFVYYGQDTVVYRISTPRPVDVVENEIWWPGWSVRVCDAKGCNPAMPATSTAQALRAWHLSPGRWTVTLHYQGPSSMPGYLCLLAGFMLVLGATVLVSSRGRAGRWLVNDVA